MASEVPITTDQLKTHSSPDDCWLLINGVVWDFTEFAPKHPGGVDIIYRHSGRDASNEYNGIHAPSLVTDQLGSSKRVGSFDVNSPGVDKLLESEPAFSKNTQKTAGRRPLQAIMSAHDFEEAASENLSAKAWAFFSSAATDLVTMHANMTSFHRIWLRPQVLRDVSVINTETKMLGVDMNFPLFACPTAIAKLAHPDGELVIAKGCSRSNTPQIISTNASFSMTEITAAADIPFFLQLYVNKDRAVSEKLLKQAESCGMRGVFVTVDQPTPAKREADERIKADSISISNGVSAVNDAKGGGLGRVMGGFIDASLTWEDIKWLRQATSLPIVLKGIQTATDAIRAVEHGVDGILIGNHGGRSLDTSTPSILVLLELRNTCPTIFDHIEVYLDGGIRRGTDIFKAICLGARAVGMGRHFLYAANYGSEGVDHLIETMRDEFQTTMKMMGCTDLSQLHPGLLNTMEVERMIPRTAPEKVIMRSRLSRL